MKASLRTFFGLMFLTLLLATASHAFAKSPASSNPNRKPAPCVEKIYLNPSDIQFLDNQILVNIENTPKRTLALYSDDKGIFVLTKKRQGRCPEEYWECGTCGGCSPWHAPECDWCGYD